MTGKVLCVAEVARWWLPQSLQKRLQYNWCAKQYSHSPYQAAHPTNQSTDHTESDITQCIGSRSVSWFSLRLDFCAMTRSTTYAPLFMFEESDLWCLE